MAYSANVMSLTLPFRPYENRSGELLRVCVCSRWKSPGTWITS